MCGVVGLVLTNGEWVNQTLYDALMVLQHRGQDAAGIMTCDGDAQFHLRKKNGMVQDVFRTRDMRDLIGSMGIAHVRYPTAGSNSVNEAQPFYVNSPYGIAMGHNGNITNAKEQATLLFEQDRRHLNTTSDSEVLLNVFAHELGVENKRRVNEEDVFAAINRVHKRVKGGYAVTGMIAGYAMFAFRDPYGLRPLVFGERTNELGKKDYMVASESVALDVMGFKLIRDLAPGEGLVVTEEGQLYTKECADEVNHMPCSFEFVYLARPDTWIDEVSVYKSRMRMGMKLADKIKRVWPTYEQDIDVIIPIPDTSRSVALEMAKKLKIPYREGFVKNRYVGRTFIMPGQAQRKKSVRQKLNAMGSEFEGKRVMLVDDSIVRGTTSKQIVAMARESGATKVYFASAAPPVRYPYVYGIDMPTPNELVAHNRTEDEVGTLIGVERIVYQDLEDLVASIREGNPKIQACDTSCFSGVYATGDISADYLQSLGNTRNDKAKKKKNK